MKKSKRGAMIGLTACVLAFGALDEIKHSDQTADVGYYIASKSGGGPGWEVANTAAGGFVGAYVGAKVGGMIGSAGGPVGAFAGAVIGAW